MTRRRGSLFLGALASVMVYSAAGYAVPLPFSADFEGYGEGVDLEGDDGWTVSTNNVPGVTGAAIVSSVAYQGGKSCSLTNSTSYAAVTLEQTFDDETATNLVWGDFFAKPNFMSYSGSFPTNSSAVFYVKTNGSVVVYDGEIEQTLTNRFAIPADTWIRFTVKLDYVSRKWDLWVNSIGYATNLSFYDANQAVCTNFSVIEGSTNTPSYLDYVYVGTNFNWAPGVNNADGAVAIGATNATLMGELAAGTNPTLVVIYYGPTDGGTNKDSWLHSTNMWVNMGETFSNVVEEGLSADTLYYYRTYSSNAIGEAWSFYTYVWMAQTRLPGGWHLLSVPVDYHENRLNAALGAALSEGLPTSGRGDTDETLWLQNASGDFDGYWWSNSLWVTTAEVPATSAVPPYAGYWIKRSDDAGSSTIAGLTGRKVGTCGPMAVAPNRWTLVGWPRDAKTTSDGVGTAAQGWGFASNGAVAATGFTNADNMRVLYNGSWHELYLNTNYLWYERGNRLAPAPYPLQPGKAYFYYHRGASSMTWAPPTY